VAVGFMVGRLVGVGTVVGFGVGVKVGGGRAATSMGKEGLVTLIFVLAVEAIFIFKFKELVSTSDLIKATPLKTLELPISRVI